MEKIKYTFVVPAYNSEKYIFNCISSICNDIEETKLGNLCEILIIENGSIDNTTMVVENIIKNININIKIYHSEKGVSNARNVGIRNATGDYLIFMDSDDLWLSGSLKRIEDDIKTEKSDIYIYSFIKGKFHQKYDECKKNIHLLKNALDVESIKKWLISKPTDRMQAWGKVYRRNIILENNIFFDSGLKYSEDSEFVIRYLFYAKKVYVSNVTIYKYVISQNSAMRTYDKDRIKEYIKSMEKSKEFLINKYNCIPKEFHKYVLSHMNIILVHDVFDIRNKKIFKNIKLMKKIKNEEIFNEALKKISLKACLSKYYLPELFLKFHFNLMVAFLCYLKSYINNK